VPNTQYLIQESGLPPPHADCVLEKALITAGKTINVGAQIVLGIKDRGMHIHENNYFPKLLSIETRHMIFWDECTKWKTLPIHKYYLITNI
jgi:hypothetical protein